MRIRYGLPLAVLATAWLLPPWPLVRLEPAGPAEAEVLKELKQYYADLSARDWAAFSAHFWPEATMTTVWQPEGETSPRVVVISIPEFVAQAPRGPGSKAIFEEHMQKGQVRVYRDLAHVWASYKARFGDPGQVLEWSGIDAFTLMKHDGRWKIVALAYTTSGASHKF